MKYITVKQILEIHKTLIEEFGGTKGIRSKAGLESAIFRIQATFDGKELYKNIFEKAAALFESLLKNHPFFDGNKRIAFLASTIFLEINGYKTKFNQAKTHDFIIKVLTKKTPLTKIISFFKMNSQ